MIRLVFLLLVLIHLTSALRCIEVKRFNLLDCSRLDINDTKRLPPSLEWVKFLDLSHNEIITINVTKLLSIYSNLRFIDIRSNPNFDCQFVKEDRIAISSDCELKSSTTSTRHVPPRSSVLSTTTSTRHVPPRSSALSTTASTRHVPPRSSVLSTTASTRQQTTSIKYVSPSVTLTHLTPQSRLLFLLLVIIGPSIGFVLVCVCVYMGYRKYKQRVARQPTVSQHELVSLGPIRSMYGETEF